MNRFLLIALLLIQEPAPDPFATVSTELLKLARFCVAEKSYVEARSVLAKALEINPFDAALKEEQQKIPARSGSPKSGFLKRYADEKRKADQKCGEAMADLAIQYNKAGQAEKFQKQLFLIQKHFPSDRLFEKVGAVYFEPYLKWIPRADADRLKEGRELVDGTWIDAAAVAALNKKHATWDDPWVLTDDTHEVKTTLPLRVGNKLLAHVGTFRALFLQKFAGAWDLRKPDGKLPVVVTETQKELRAQMEDFVGERKLQSAKFNGAAYYLQTNAILNPCFVTLEPTDVAGKTCKTTVDQILLAVRHEMTHQLAFEYCKYDYDPDRRIENQFWAVEGVANFMQGFVYDKGEWRLSRPKSIPMGDGFLEADIAWCVKNRERLPMLAKFFSLNHAEFMTIENYHTSAAVAWFLMEGEEGRYRSGFVKLLETIHKVHDTRDTFLECFPDAEPKAMQDQFLKFVGEIKLD